MSSMIALAAVVWLAGGATPQGGQGGAGGFGGGGMQGQGQRQQLDRSLDSIESRLNMYLDAEETKSILTPGEYTEWPLPLKAGEVVIADVRSEAFDPALQIVGDGDKVLAENDDRFPGDQRPLLLWRCERDGEYKLRGRCFRDRAGGQMFLRSKVYRSVDLTPGQTTDIKLEKAEPLLLRIPSKAGQINLLSVAASREGEFVNASFTVAISPIGLPDARIGAEIASLDQCLVMAPVKGDYYVLAQPFGRAPATLRVRHRELAAQPLALSSGIGTAKATQGVPSLWSITVKAGEAFHASVPDLQLGADLIVAEQPDISKFDLKKPESNPFFPKAKDVEPEKGRALVTLPARARDSRAVVFVAKRDATVWIATDGKGTAETTFNLAIKPAAKPFGASEALGGRLRIGDTDYWSFEAKVGEVMRFQSSTTTFAQRLELRDPDLDVRWGTIAPPDQAATNWELIVQKPGRYLVAVSCLGDGGGGEYSLNREVFVPKELRKGSASTGEIGPGEVHVWKLAAKPEEPLLVRWRSKDWNYSISVRDENGAGASLPMVQIDPENRFGILKVDRPRTFLIVLIPSNSKASYSIEASDLPGYRPGTALSSGPDGSVLGNSR